MDGAIDLDVQEPCLGNLAGKGLASAGRKRQPLGYKFTKADIARQAGSLVFQETLKELMVKKQEAIVERVERWRRDKEATTKRFVDLQERSVATDEAIAKAKLLEVEAKTKAWEAEAKARFLKANAKTKILEAEAMLMAEETKIMLTDLDSISDPRPTGMVREEAKDDPRT
jgi:hypothetical protein